MAERPSQLLKRLLRASPLVRRALVASSLLGLATTIAIVVQASAVASALGAIFYHHDADITRQVVWFVVATATRAATVGLSEPLTARIAAPVRRDLRRRLLDDLLRRGAAQSVDATVQLATKGVGAIEEYLANYVPALVLATLAPLVLLGYLTWRDPLSGLIVAVSVGLLPVFMVLLGLEAKDKMHERWDDQQRLAGYFGDVVRGMGVLKAHNRSRHAVSQLDDVGDALSRTTMATLKVAFLSSFALELLSSLATALVALVLGVRLMNGSLGLSVALAVLLVTPEVYLPLRRSAAQYHAGADGIAAAGVVLDLVGAERAHAGTAVAPRRAPTIVLREVSVGPGTHTGAPRVSGVIAAGELTVIRGRSGSGKTTLLRSIIGLREVPAGTIIVDGTDLAQLDMTQWQSRIAYLPQDPRLPGSTAREVLRMGEDIGDEQMRGVLASLALDLELDRELGEGASALSAGQRRRLALARCLVRQPLLLVLDEPTAHLDHESEDLVVDAIRSLSMTRVVATHREFASDHVIEVAATKVHRD